MTGINQIIQQDRRATQYRLSLKKSNWCGYVQDQQIWSWIRSESPWWWCSSSLLFISRAHRSSPVLPCKYFVVVCVEEHQGFNCWLKCIILSFRSRWVHGAQTIYLLVFKTVLTCLASPLIVVNNLQSWNVNVNLYRIYIIWAMLTGKGCLIMKQRHSQFILWIILRVRGQTYCSFTLLICLMKKAFFRVIVRLKMTILSSFTDLCSHGLFLFP